MYEKCWMSSCTTCLIKNLNISMSLDMDLIDLLWSLSIMAWISLTNSGVLMRMIRVTLLSCYTFGLIQFFLNPLHCPQIDTKHWNLHIEASSMNAKEHNIPFPNFWKSVLCHSAAFLTDNAQLSLVCSSQYIYIYIYKKKVSPLTKKKERIRYPTFLLGFNVSSIHWLLLPVIDVFNNLSICTLWLPTYNVTFLSFLFVCYIFFRQSAINSAFSSVYYRVRNLILGFFWLYL